MGVRELILRRCTETITLARQSSHSSGGDATYGEQFTMGARVERSTGEAGDLEGRRVNGGARLLCVDEVLLGDLVWLPEADTSSTNAALRVATVDAVRNLDGDATHWEVTVA